MTQVLIIFFLALSVDLIIGDPQKITHPVVLIGKIIDRLESLLYPRTRNQAVLILRGGILVFLVVSTTYIITGLIIYLSFIIHQWVGVIISGWLFAATLATKSLKDAAMAIYRPLVEQDLVTAREKLAQVVSRETNNLPAEEITRGTVETVAENTVDGVIAPIFFGIIGGPALAMAYKAVNTLDSMLGYKNERYLYFGRLAAKLDDFANYLPARITGFCMLLATFLIGLPGKKALQTWQECARLHPSPNGGIPEAVVAGALRVRLGGYNQYHGQMHFRAYLGTGERPLHPDDILITVRLMYLTTFIFSSIVIAGNFGWGLLGGKLWLFQG